MKRRQAEHTIPVLSKALRLVQSLAEDPENATSASLSKKLSISSSTTYRILQTLAAHDWLRGGGGKFVFSSGLLPLLKPLSDYRRLFDYLEKPLEKLVSETGLTAKISTKQGDCAVTVFRVESPRGFSPTSKIGASFPLAYGSSGACLLAALDDDEIDLLLTRSPKEVWQLQKPDDVWRRVKAARTKGICYDAGQFQAPVHGISSPILGADGKIFAAVTVVGWAGDFSREKLTGLQQRLLDCATDCSSLFGQTEAA